MRRYAAEIPSVRYFERQVRCREACPVRTDAGGYVRAIVRGADEEAFRIASSPNPLVSICGRICAHPCEEACRRGKLDEPVAIRALKRFVSERFGLESPGRGLRGIGAAPPPKVNPDAPRIAVVGAGPAGLACAHDLARAGYRVTLFEASPVGGGMVRLGIPEYRLPRDLIRAEVDSILALGVEMRTGWRMGIDFSVRDLKESGYRAVFLALGAFRGRDLRIPGADLDGIINGVDFLINVNLGYHVQIGERVLVIGGGNVAMDVARAAARESAEGTPAPVEDDSTLLDVARAAVRLGSTEVHVYALESRAELPAHDYEVEEAEKEGIVIHPSWGPKRFVGKDAVTGVELQRVASVFDAEGRFNPRFVPGSEEIREADTVLLAIGQGIDSRAFALDPEIVVTSRGTIAVDPVTLESSLPGVFAGGDAAFGPRNIIAAIADGRRAARAIQRFLGEREEEQGAFEMRPVRLDRAWESYEQIPRVELPMIPLERRVGFREVEEAFEETAARREASRCLWCHVHPIFDSDRCILCGGCADVCPVSCLHLVRASNLELPEETVNAIARGLAGPEGAPLTAILMESERCIRCGLCAERCPTEAISMEEFRWTKNLV